MGTSVSKPGRGRLASLGSGLVTLDTRIARQPTAGTGRAGQYSQLYTHSRWRKLRARQLQKEPLCRFCAANGRVARGTVCDHINPHRGDMVAFWSGPFQSLCKHCHDSAKQTQEKQELGA